MKFLLLAILPAFLSCSDPVTPEISMDYVSTIEIFLAASDQRSLAEKPKSYVYGQVSIEGGDSIDIEVRLKGSGSFQPIHQKPSFKIKFPKWFNKGRTSKLTLNSMVQDPTMMRECFGYDLMRDMGIHAPQCSYAKVYLNGIFYGIYANIESMDENFVKESFSDDEVGNLYDIEFAVTDWIKDHLSRFKLKTNKSNGISPELVNLVSVSSLTGEEYLNEVGSKIDYEYNLKFIAMELLLHHGDGFFQQRNNYLLYQNPSTNRFQLIPWGMDQSQLDYEFPIFGLKKKGQSHFFTYCRKSPDCREDLTSQMKKILEKWDSEALRKKLISLDQLIKPLRDIDTKTPHDKAQIEKSVHELFEFYEKRKSFVQNQINWPSDPIHF